MSLLSTWILGLLVLLVAASLTWLASLRLRDVSIVDSLWGLFFVLAAATYFVSLNDVSVRAGRVHQAPAAAAKAKNPHQTQQSPKWLGCRE